MEFNATYLESFGYEKIYDKYWFMKNYNIVVFPIKAKNLELCIIDELKPLFNIEKIGTRWTKIKESIYILYKVTILDNQIIEPIKVTDFHNKQCYKLYFFRELLGIPTNKNVLEAIVINNEFVNFYDIKRQKLSSEDCGKISVKEKTEFYLKLTRKEIARFCFNIDDPYIIMKLRDDIQNIIKNIQEEYIYLSYMIYNKLLRIHELK